MSKKKPFSDPRWTQPLGGKVIGKVESTEEEKQESKKKLQKHLKKIGVIKEE
ncbi:hypothetical protein [Lysinibacillus pakistanensis]|uniref:hypothetical protein n=1 Tax=Lysinibacillus pakistanensis TaxID=759811 RepID=UPI003D2E3F19